MKEYTAQERADIYREAAELIDVEETHWCDEAIIMLVRTNFGERPDISQFVEYYEYYDESDIPISPWWTCFGDTNCNRNHRVMALLFAAEMALNP